MRAASLRLWPRSLAARVSLLLMLTLAVAHLLTLGWLAGGRAMLARTAMIDYLGPDLASAVKVLDGLPPSERAAWLPVLSRPNYRYALAPAPASTDDRSTAAARLVAAVQTSLDGNRALRVRRDEGAEVRWLELQLADGTPLSVALWPLEAGVTPLMAGIVALQFAVFGAVGWVAVRSATRPLTRLASAADALRPGDAAPVLPEDGPSEVARAAASFNAMQQRIRAHDAERALILAAVSHDLKTPLTRMRLRAELLDDSDLRDKLQADLAHMQALVEEGLAHARSAQAGAEPTCRVDLPALLDALVCDHIDMGHAVSLHAQPIEPVLTRPLALRRLLGNLVDNAVRFGGSAAVALSRRDDGVRITVSDHGPGIPDHELARMRAPFTRLESSRHRDTGGTGLGLAIVDELARALGGRVELANRPGGGLEARLDLPARSNLPG
jgi:signal transduction histidine kinase